MRLVHRLHTLATALSLIVLLYEVLLGLCLRRLYGYRGDVTLRILFALDPR